MRLVAAAVVVRCVEREDVTAVAAAASVAIVTAMLTLPAVTVTVTCSFSTPVIASATDCAMPSRTLGV